MQATDNSSLAAPINYGLLVDTIVHGDSLRITLLFELMALTETVTPLVLVLVLVKVNEPVEFVAAGLLLVIRT